MDQLENMVFRGWIPILTVLLGTGMRIGECLGLCWSDVDFEKRIIEVNKTLVYRPDEKREIIVLCFNTKDRGRYQNYSYPG